MNEEVKSILGNEIIVDKVKIPVEHLKYKGSKKTFITWKLLDETPELCANDDDLCSVCPLDIDIYSDKYSKKSKTNDERKRLGLEW